ncbi:MAG: hypothetical protein JXB29_06720, partial [Sedimentisphaerales bacterium]|nr:hypothetical protein [Sedimentisphaerales bacterium]
GAIGAHGRRKAKEMLCLSNLRQWAVIWSIYTADNNGYFHKGRKVSGVDKDCWVYVLQDYHDKDDKIRCCPEASTPWWDKNGNDTGALNPFAAWGMLGPWWPGGGIKDAYYYGSYGIEDHLTNTGSKANWNHCNHAGTENIPVQLGCYFLSGWLLQGDGQEDCLYPPEYNGYFPDDPIGCGNMARFCLNRHNGKVNGVFMDFSARPIGLKELWTLKWGPQFNTENAWTLAGNGGDYDATYQKWADWGDGWLTDFKIY